MSKMKELEKTLEMLRDELLSIRPKTAPFSRPFTFQRETNGLYKTTTETMEVTLSIFGVSDEIEVSCTKVGEKIKKTKEAIRSLAREEEAEKTMGYKAMLRSDYKKVIEGHIKPSHPRLPGQLKNK